MIVEQAQRARVLVQTSGNIALRIDRDVSEGPVRLFLRRSQHLLMFAFLSAGVVAVAWAAHKPTAEIRQAEQRLTIQLAGLEARIDQMTASAADQPARLNQLIAKVDSVATAVDAVPAQVGSSIERSTSTVMVALSDLRLRPAFPLSPAGESVAAPNPVPAAYAGPKARLKRMPAFRQIVRFRPKRNRRSGEAGTFTVRPERIAQQSS